MADQFNILDRNSSVGGPITGGQAMSQSFLRPATSLAENMPRFGTKLENNAAVASGTLRMNAIVLPSGLLVSSISFCSSTQAAVTPTNQWFALFDSSRVLLAISADDTSTAWGANTIKTLTLSTPFRTSYSGIHYCGVVVAAATPPSLSCLVTTTAPVSSAPQAAGNTTDTGLTTPVASPFTAGAITGSGAIAYCFVS